MNKHGMTYTRTKEQRIAVKKMFEQMKPTFSRFEIIKLLNLRK